MDRRSLGIEKFKKLKETFGFTEENGSLEEVIPEDFMSEESIPEEYMAKKSMAKESIPEDSMVEESKVDETKSEIADETQESILESIQESIPDENENVKKEIKKIVAFGSTLIVDPNKITKYIKPKPLSPSMEKRFLHLARPLTKKVHPSCVPNYTFKPTLRKTKKSIKRIPIQEWVTINSRPKPVQDRPPFKIIRHTSPRTAKERKEWEFIQSRPKQVPEPEIVPKKLITKTKEEWEAYLINMSKPKRINQKTPPPRHVNPDALKYEITPHMIELAQPKVVDPEFQKNLDYNFDDKTKRALHYTISARMEELAKPRVYPPPKDDTRPDAFKVNPAALQYKPTKRILELAKPREYPQDDYDPYYVKPVPEGYVISARMEELSRPRKQK